MELALGYLNYAIALATMIALYGVLALGLNLQWGLAGLFNVGVAGFFAVGAYVSAILTAAASDQHLGGFDLPFAVGPLAAMIAAAAVAWAVGRICIRLRSDYLAIASIGIAEILRLVLKNEQWATNGTRGISNIARPFETLAAPWGALAWLALLLAVLAALFLLLQRAQFSPWGRTMRAIRDNEAASRAAGKNVERFRMQAFVLGSALMGLGGALTAHYFKFVGPEATDTLLTTFLVWVMLIVGGSGNNLGAIVGAAVVWTLWSATELLTFRLEGDWVARVGYVRMFLVGLLLQIVLQRYARGILPERLPGGGRSGGNAI